MTKKEREALNSLSKNEHIVIQSADKGGKIVLMDKKEYKAECEKDLSNDKFYEKMTEDPNGNYADEVLKRADEMKSSDLITAKEHKIITADLDNQRTPIFYGLPKVHKNFQKFPPLRPIVSHMSSCTRKLSEFIDSFLKRQAQLAGSFIRDTKHFLQKIEELKKEQLPENSILVTMDVRALYTNIDHEEGVEACIEKLDTRKNISIPSTTIGSLILLVLQSNAFRFGDAIYRQIMGTAMGTPMAPNYANLFMAKFEENVITSYHASTGLKPLVWYRYIDDIFLIWTHGDDELQKFLTYVDSFSDARKMKSAIRFEVNKSQHEVNFLDVKVSLEKGTLRTSLFSKPTDAHLYLNYSSSHPRHVLRNIPKGQFIRIKRICSEPADYHHHSQLLCNFFVERGFEPSKLKETRQEVGKMDRMDLLKEKEKPKRDPQTIFVCDWHPSLSQAPSILRQHFPVLQSDDHLSKVFTESPTVAFRRPRTIRNIIVRNDINRPARKPTSTSECGSCILCKDIRKNPTITNTKKNITIKLKDGGNCKTKNVVYAARCKKHDLIYIGHTGNTLDNRFGKHRYDIKKRPGNSELAEHFHNGHDKNDLEVCILQSGASSPEERELQEEKWICRLQTLHPTGINQKIQHYAKDMYASYKQTL